jgi:hypothetical protein
MSKIRPDIVGQMAALGFSIYKQERFLRSPIFEVIHDDALAPIAADADPYKAISQALLIHFRS